MYDVCPYIASTTDVLQETEDDLETSLEDSEEEYEGNKDAARALMRVKQKLDGYEEGEMRSVHGQVMFEVKLSDYQLSPEVKAVKKWIQTSNH